MSVDRRAALRGWQWIVSKTKSLYRKAANDLGTVSSRGAGYVPTFHPMKLDK
jgi:hypothetical protein